MEPPSKDGFAMGTFMQKVTLATIEANRREIPYPGYSPFEIHFGFQPTSKLESDSSFDNNPEWRFIPFSERCNDW